MTAIIEDRSESGHSKVFYKRKVYIDEYGNLYFKLHNSRHIAKFRGEDEIRKCGYINVTLSE